MKHGALASHHQAHADTVPLSAKTKMVNCAISNCNEIAVAATIVDSGREHTS